MILAQPKMVGFFGDNGVPLTPSNLPLPAQPPAGTPPPVQGNINLAPFLNNYQTGNDLLAEGASTAPLHSGSPFEGLARLGQAYLGGIMRKHALGDIQSARQQNKQAILGDFDNGNLGALITSDDPVAQKLGSAIIEQRMKNDPGKYTTMDDGTVVWQSLHGGKPEVVKRANVGLPRGYRWNTDGTDLEFVPGGPADPEVIKKNAGERRAPKASTDQTGVLPWARKW